MQSTTERLEWNSWNGHLVRADAHAHGGADSDVHGDVRAGASADARADGHTDAYLLHVPTTAVFGVDSLGLSVIEHCRVAGGRSVDELVALLADRYSPARVRAFAAELRTLEMLQPSGSLQAHQSEQRQGELLSAQHSGAQREYRMQSVVHLLLQGRSGQAGGRAQNGFRDGGAQRRSVAEGGRGAGAGEHRILRRRAAEQRGADQAGRGLCRGGGGAVGAADGFFDDDECDAADAGAHRIFRRTPVRHFDFHRRAEGHSRPSPQERGRAGHLRGGGAQGAGAAGAISVAAGGGARDSRRRHHGGRGDSRPFEGRDRLSRGGLCAGDGRGGGGPCAVRRGAQGGAPRLRAPRRGLPAGGAARGEQWFLQHAPADDRSARGTAQVAALRRGGGAAWRWTARATSISVIASRARICRRSAMWCPGIDGERLGAFIDKAMDREGTHCETCRIRNLCAGGCYHESYSRFGDAHHRTYHYCNLLRSWVDFGVRVYADIQRHNPGFFTRHLEPRSAIA